MSQPSSDGAESKIKDAQLPLSRIKIIMKSSPGVENISQDSVYLATKATELFIQHLVKKTMEKRTSETNKLEYKDLAEVVQTSNNLNFLRAVIPRKITYAEAKARSNAKPPKETLQEWRDAYDDVFFNNSENDEEH